MFKLPSTEVQELFPTGRQPEPIIAKVDDMFAIVKESLTALLNPEGESVNQSAVKWPSPPIANGIIFNFPISYYSYINLLLLFPLVGINKIKLKT